MFEDLRRAFAERGLGPRDLLLPGETDEPLQGGLVLRPAGSGFELVTVDYGQAVVLRRWPTAEEASAGALEYLARPLPAPERANETALASVAASATGHYDELRARLADGTSLLIELPAGLVLDRIGALDGVQLFPSGTSVEARALPPTALVDGAALHRFITAGDVLVRAALVQPWFGQPGGGLRFTLADDYVGIRDLVVADRLRRVELIPAPAV